MNQYFPKPFRSFGGNVIQTSSFALKANLANLKSGVDKLDIEILAPVPVDLSKLSDLVKN